MNDMRVCVVTPGLFFKGKQQQQRGIRESAGSRKTKGNRNQCSMQA
jgi:hypothetical protein